MNSFTNFILFTFMLTTAILISNDNFSTNIYPQLVVKEVVIGPDQSKEGDSGYNPSNIIITKGDQIMWLNKDFGIHTVTENQGLFSSKDLRPDQTFEYTLENAGTYDYHCKLHPEMVGKIIVT